MINRQELKEMNNNKIIGSGGGTYKEFVLTGASNCVGGHTIIWAGDPSQIPDDYPCACRQITFGQMQNEVNLKLKIKIKK